MAVAVKGGYDYEFVPPLPEDFNCVICQCALRSPMQIEKCGHRFCEPCFLDLKSHAVARNNEITCPFDRQTVPLAQVFGDKGTERMILNWKVKCQNHKDGCEWIGELNNLAKHESECPKTTKNQTEVLKELQEVKLQLASCKDELKNLSAKFEQFKVEYENEKSNNAMTLDWDDPNSLTPISNQYHWKCKELYSSSRNMERFSPLIYHKDYCFQLGVLLKRGIFSVEDVLFVNLYRYRGKFDPRGRLKEQFNSFECNVDIRKGNNDVECLIFDKKRWVLGNDYMRSLGQEFQVNCFNNDEFILEGYYHFDIQFLNIF